MEEIIEANDSDKFSENGFDSESSDEDMEKEKFKEYFNAASKMAHEFEKAYYGSDYDKRSAVSYTHLTLPTKA